MSVISAVPGGTPTTDLLRSLSDVTGLDVMEALRRWSSGDPVVTLAILGPGFEELAGALGRVHAWAREHGIPLDLYETDAALPPPGSRPPPEDGEYVLNAIQAALDLRAEPFPEDRP